MWLTSLAAPIHKLKLILVPNRHIFGLTLHVLPLSPNFVPKRLDKDFGFFCKFFELSLLIPRILTLFELSIFFSKESYRGEVRELTFFLHISCSCKLYNGHLYQMKMSRGLILFRTRNLFSL